MNADLKTLQIFCAAIRERSFVAAARELDVDPSVVSRAIAGLESHLDTPLFVRTTRRVEPTEAGMAYFNAIARPLTELLSAGENLGASATQPEGHIRIAVSTAFGQQIMVPVLAGLRRAHPALTFDLQMNDAFADMAGEQMDVAFRLVEPAVGADMAVRKLGDVRYHLCCAPDWLSRNPMATPADLPDNVAVMFSSPAFRHLWRFRGEDGRVIAIRPTGPIVATGALAILDAVERGMGPGLLADWTIAPALDAGTLVDPFPTYEATPHNFDTAVWAVYPQRGYLPAKVRVVLDAVQERLASLGQPQPATA
ncbi:MAG: LysR family transcriptional regulator [Pseudomonadota bacterium]